jgi:hypothetical protein
MIKNLKKGKSEISHEYSEFGGLGILPNQIIVKTEYMDVSSLSSLPFFLPLPFPPSPQVNSIF